MRIEHVLMALAIFAVVIITGYNLVLDQDTRYNLGIDSTGFNEYRDAINESELLKESLRSDTQLESVEDESTEESFFSGAVKGAVGIYDAGAVVGRIITKSIKGTGFIPGYMGTLFIIVISVMAGSFVLYMLMRFKPQ